MNRIKSLILAIGVALCVMPAAAQVYQSKSYIKKTTVTKTVSDCKWKKWQWYGRLGVSIPTSSFDFNVSAKAGFDLDFGFQRRMGCHGWYWGMDLAFFTGGAKIGDGVAMDRPQPYNRKGKSLSVYGGRFSPITFGWRARFANDFTFDIHAGLAIAAGASEKVEKAGSFQEFSIDPTQPLIPFGFGFWYKKITLDFTYHAGLINTFSGSVDNNHYGWMENSCSNLLIRVGYAF